MVQDSIRVATLNCRNTADRWKSRRGLLIAQLREVAPDICGLQELRRWPSQGRWIARRADKNDPNAYRLTSAWKGGWYKWAWEGIGTISRLPVVGTARHGLGDDRVVQRTTVLLPSGAEFDVYNTHLHHPPAATKARTRQARRLLAWAERRGGVPHMICGDLNGVYESAEIRAFVDGGLRSVFTACGLPEPQHTFPAPASRGWGNPGKTIDFILVSEDVEVRSARVAFDQPDPDDDRLSASDHYGLVAELVVGGGVTSAK